MDWSKGMSARIEMRSSIGVVLAMYASLKNATGGLAVMSGLAQAHVLGQSVHRKVAVKLICAGICSSPYLHRLISRIG